MTSLHELRSLVIKLLLLQFSCLIHYRHVSAGKTLELLCSPSRRSPLEDQYPNTTTPPTPASSEGNGNTSNGPCGSPSCRISLDAITLTYPTPFQLIEATTTATLIPVVSVFPNGTEVTVTSTFEFYSSGGANQTFVTPSTVDLTWDTLGTTL
jgi:hypothetical protein